MNMPTLMEEAKRQLAEVTGLKPLTVTRASKDGKGWRIGVEMLEMSRIPTATDVVGCYEIILSEEGDLVNFGRRRTRLRGEPTEEEKI